MNILSRGRNCPLKDKNSWTTSQPQNGEWSSWPVWQRLLNYADLWLLLQFLLCLELKSPVSTLKSAEMLDLLLPSQYGCTVWSSCPAFHHFLFSLVFGVSSWTWFVGTHRARPLARTPITKLWRKEEPRMAERKPVGKNIASALTQKQMIADRHNL